MPKPQYARQYQVERGRLLASPAGQFCFHCGAKATEADHQPPVALHRHAQGTGCCVLVASCTPCRLKQAGALNQAKAEAELLVVEPDGFGVDDAAWDVPWLDRLRDVPANGTWPRLMTAPHPRAVDSLGAEAARWAASRRGQPWRWWQELVAVRLLEIDAEGRLVWETMILSLARQVGKTWWLGDITNWRFESSARFGTPQTVLSCGKDLAIVTEMQRPARAAALAAGYPYRVVSVNGLIGIERLDDGARHMIRSKESVYGNAADMATVDEAWKIAAAVVEDGLLPTMVERDQTQLLLISTAHRRATSLMIGRRAGALEQLGAPDDDGPLLMEWSSPRTLARDDRDGWRMASPYWTAKRERWIAQRLAAALSGESDDVDEPDPMESFDSQWLNRWPAKRISVLKGEPVIEPGVWAEAYCEIDAVGPLVIGVEDHHGHGAAVAFCGVLPDGRFVLGGDLLTSRAEAYEVAARAAKSRSGSTLVAGASLFDDAELALMPVRTLKRAGVTETSGALANLRDLIATGRLVHDGSTELTSQVHQARVVAGQRGLALIPRTRSDLLRSAAWALRIASTSPLLTPSIR